MRGHMGKICHVYGGVTSYRSDGKICHVYGGVTSYRSDGLQCHGIWVVGRLECLETQRSSKRSIHTISKCYEACFS